MSTDSKQFDSSNGQADSSNGQAVPSSRHFGLIGHPIAHSLSPKLFKDYHPNSTDIYDLIETPIFEKAYSTFLKKYDAVNVTAPFKEFAFHKADLKDPLCDLIGATNLLVKEGDSVKAYNTDMKAVMNCLWKGIDYQVSSGIWNPMVVEKELSALVIGCGGAGKAAAVACLNLGLKTIIANRTYSRTRTFVDRISEYRKKVPFAVDIRDLEMVIKESSIIVYAIPQRIPEIINADLTDKIILEANYLTRSIPQVCIPKTSLYISGTEWLSEQAKATYSKLSQLAKKQ